MDTYTHLSGRPCTAEYRVGVQAAADEALETVLCRDPESLGPEPLEEDDEDS